MRSIVGNRKRHCFRQAMYNFAYGTSKVTYASHRKEKAVVFWVRRKRKLSAKVFSKAAKTQLQKINLQNSGLTLSINWKKAKGQIR